jgi:hypothetical protein
VKDVQLDARVSSSYFWYYRIMSPEEGPPAVSVHGEEDSPSVSVYTFRAEVNSIFSENFYLKPGK